MSNINSLREATLALNTAVTETSFRRNFERKEGRDPDRDEQWRPTYLTYSAEVTDQLLFDVSLGIYFAVHAAAQLDKCVRMLDDPNLDSLADAELLRNVRNYVEHWDDPDGRAGRWLAAASPDGLVGRFFSHPDLLVFENLELVAVYDWAYAVDQRNRLDLTLAGCPVDAKESEPRWIAWL
jgi:hypothetical protein